MSKPNRSADISSSVDMTTSPYSCPACRAPRMRCCRSRSRTSDWQTAPHPPPSAVLAATVRGVEPQFVGKDPAAEIGGKVGEPYHAVRVAQSLRDQQRIDVVGLKAMATVDIGLAQSGRELIAARLVTRFQTDAAEATSALRPALLISVSCAVEKSG